MLPFYNADVEQSGLPEAAERLRADVAGADALIFAVPEYNLSVPGVLKNAMEWLSRQPDLPAHGKPCAEFGASSICPPTQQQGIGFSMRL